LDEEKYLFVLDFYYDYSCIPGVQYLGSLPRSAFHTPSITYLTLLLSFSSLAEYMRFNMNLIIWVIFEKLEGLSLV